MANVNAPGVGMINRPYSDVSESARGGRPSIDEQIRILISDTSTIFHSAESGSKRFDGVILSGSAYLDRVYGALLDAGFVAVFRKGIDEPVLPDLRLYEVNADRYLMGY